MDWWFAYWSQELQTSRRCQKKYYKQDTKGDAKRKKKYVEVHRCSPDLRRGSSVSKSLALVDNAWLLKWYYHILKGKWIRNYVESEIWTQSLSDQTRPLIKRLDLHVLLLFSCSFLNLKSMRNKIFSWILFLYI